MAPAREHEPAAAVAARRKAQSVVRPVSRFCAVWEPSKERGGLIWRAPRAHGEDRGVRVNTRRLVLV